MGPSCRWCAGGPPAPSCGRPSHPGETHEAVPVAPPSAPPPSSTSLLAAARILARGVRHARRSFVVAVVASFFYGVGTAATGWWVGRTTQDVVVPALGAARAAGAGSGGPAGAVAAAAAAAGPGDVWRAGAALALIFAVTVLAVLGRRIAAGVTMFRVQAHYRRAVTRRYLDLPLAWHRRRSTGALLNHASSDVDTTWQVLAPLPFALGTIVMLLTSAAFMLSADPVLGAVALSVVPALVGGSVLYRRRVSPIIARSQALRGEVASVAHESFEGALVVKVLGRARGEHERFAHAAQRLRAANTAAGATRGAFDAVIEALPALGTLAVLGVGAVRIAAGTSQAGDVVQVAYLLTLLAFPVRAIGWVLADLPRVVVGHARLDGVLSAPLRPLPPATALPGGAGAPAPAGLDAVTVRHPAPDGDDGSTAGGDSTDDAGAARAHHHRRAAGAPPALDAVTLDVTAGTTLAVVGGTGAGKSTMAGLLLRLVDPASGRVVLDGVDLAALRDEPLAGAAALVPQQVFVFDDTVRANVTVGLDGVDDAQVWAALRAASADSFVAAMPRGLGTEVGERGTSLSGGQRQRLAIARALVRRPRLLVLDDATSALDPAVERSVLDALRTSSADAAAPTVVVVAYRPATIALADEVVHLEHGVVVDRGTPAELSARDPGYAELVTAYARAAAEREVAAL